jgi:DNA-binding CsgD family transcriptional regulator
MRDGKLIILSVRDRRELESVLAKRVARAGHARRARVVLLSSEGVRGVEIARRLSLSIPQVSRIRRRFFEGGVEGLRDQPKAGRGNNVPESMVRRIVATAMSPPPAGYSHCSTRVLARRVGLGATVVHKILRANDLKPHLHRTFKISRDPRLGFSASSRADLYAAPVFPPKRPCVVTSKPSWPTGTRTRHPSSGPNLLTTSSATTANSLRESRGRNTSHTKRSEPQANAALADQPLL